MTHDLLCPARGLGDHWADLCGDCKLIARVREDERKTSCAEELSTDCPCYREGRDVADDDVTFWEPHYQAGYTHGYAVALRDAVEAVRLSPSADIELVERSQVISDIEALGGKR